MTSKELAKKLGISESAVSFALNNKPGVSKETRELVMKAALDAGIQTRRSGRSKEGNGIIYIVYFKRKGVVLCDSTFFNEVESGIESAITESGYKLNQINIYTTDQLVDQLNDLVKLNASGVLLIATEMLPDDFFSLAFYDLPIVIVDNHFSTSKIDSVQINNTDSAYNATNYLINKRRQQPGYLHSSYSINNFEERKNGFYNAIKYNGMPVSDSIVHELSPSVEGAFSDMLSIIGSGEKLSPCYFADNDYIAIGAMRAFIKKGYRIPEDISIIGFDDITLASYITPSLTTVSVPKFYLGAVSARHLISKIGSDEFTYPINIQISTGLVVRNSIKANF